MSICPLAEISVDTLERRLRESPSVDTLFFHLFGTADYRQSSLFQASHAEVICQTTWGKGGIAFRCFDCEKDDNCVVCAACYFGSEEKHANHRVKLIRTQGGCCDCGDVSSWAEEGFCAQHGSLAEQNRASLSACEEADVLSQNASQLIPLVVSMTTSVLCSDPFHLGKLGLDFLLEASRLSPNVVRPLVLESLPFATLSAWVSAVCRGASTNLGEEIGQFFLSFVQLSAEFKIKFSNVFLAQYPEIVKFREPQEARHELSGLSVQLFTIPEVCHSLLRADGGLVGVVLRTLEDLLTQLKDPMTGGTQMGLIRNRQIRPEIDLAIWRVTHDLGYILNHEVVCAHLLGSAALTNQLLDCVRSLQLENLQTVKHGDHVLYENVVWRSTFKLEQLLSSALQPLAEFARRTRNGVFLSAIADRIDEFDPLKFGGEKGSFHIPLVRLLTQCWFEENMFCVSGPGSCLPDAKYFQLLLHALRALLLAAEIAADVWVRNGEGMRQQLLEYSATFRDCDVAAVQICVAMLESKSEFFRAVAILLADLPSDLLDTGLSARLTFLRSDSVTVDWIDQWWQTLLRDAVVGGSGNALDELRVRTGLGLVVEILSHICSHTTALDLVRLNSKTDDAERSALLTRCLVQQLANQKLSYSQILAGLPPALRQPEKSVEAAVEALAFREAAEAVYKLKPSALELFDYYHRVFPVSSAQFHAREDFVLKHTELIPSSKMTRPLSPIPTRIIAGLLSPAPLLLRLLTGLLRIRLAEHFAPNCLEAPVLPLSNLDPSVGFALRIVEAVRVAGLTESVENGGELLFERPPFGVRMQMDSLVQRTDLNGKEGIYFGPQLDRFCVSMAIEGRLLSKPSNVIVINDCQGASYTSILVRLLEEIARASGISESVAKTARIVLERLTGVVTHAEASSKAPSCKAAARARQARLMESMKIQQMRFTSKITSGEPDAANSTNDCICSMCRDLTKECLMAVGYCAPGTSVFRTSPHGNALANPSPYLSACMHLVHESCWDKHCAAAASRNLHYSLVGEGEVQCPVCRALSNCVIPAVEQKELASSASVRNRISKFGLSILTTHSISRQALPWRPVEMERGLEAVMEAAFTELLLSISIAPGKILSNNLASLLVRCCAVGGAGQRPYTVWTADPLAASTVDCARLFLESGNYSDLDLVKNLMALRHVQLTHYSKKSYAREMAQLAVFIAWVRIAVHPFDQADINRIGYLPEEASARLAVVESVLRISDWREGIGLMEQTVKMNPNVIVPRAVGGLVDFIPLPAKLTDLIKITLTRTCARCNTRPDDPAICLICGEMVCLDSDCCRSSGGSEGECTQHARICGAGQGVFILPFASIVLAIAAPRNCIWEGPYEDAHGEPDSYLKRSCKLTLSQRRLDQMRLLYTRASIPIEIVRQNEISGRYVPRPL